MKILFLSTNDYLGGAARATYTLAIGLRNLNLDLTMVVNNKIYDNSWVVVYQKNKLFYKLNFLRLLFDSLPLKIYSRKISSLFSLNILPNQALLKLIRNLTPTVVNIHWVSNGFFPIWILSKLKVPIVISLYDMWAFTGGCHYDSGCDGYKTSCGSCPQLQSHNNDISRIIFSIKKRLIKDSNVTVVAPSKWLAQAAKNSPIFHDKNVVVIPHGMNLEKFKPLDKVVARTALNLPINKKLILFGATGGTVDARKGYSYLKSALQHLSVNHIPGNIDLVVFGQSEGENIDDLGFPVHYLGKIFDDPSLAMLYSAVDVTVTPSLQEAFGMTAGESMACGTPAVAFRLTGAIDVIDHLENGYLAEPLDHIDLANGINWVLHQASGRISTNARNKCMDNFDLKKISTDYMNLYLELINQSQETNSLIS
jgi:glycosyltransferase involved in cell wall biosynthesis